MPGARSTFLERRQNQAVPRDGRVDFPWSIVGRKTLRCAGGGLRGQETFGIAASVSRTAHASEAAEVRVSQQTEIYTRPPSADPQIIPRPCSYKFTLKRTAGLLLHLLLRAATMAASGHFVFLDGLIDFPGQFGARAARERGYAEFSSG